MSEPQCIQVSVSQEGKLVVSWDTMGDPRALAVAVSTDVEFLDPAARYFLVPHNATNIRLDLGAASWFVRVGALLGSELHGQIAWSHTYGPTTIPGSKPICGEPAFDLPVVHTQLIHKGFRIHTGNYDTCYVFVESSMADNLRASRSKWTYSRHSGKGYFDAMGLEHPNVYTLGFRYANVLPSFTPADTDTSTEKMTTTDPATGITTTRITTTIITKATPIVPLPTRKMYTGIRPIQPTRYVQHHSGAGDQASDRADAQILNEAKFRQMKFGSHSDYLRFLAAQTKSSQEKHSTT